MLRLPGAMPTQIVLVGFEASSSDASPCPIQKAACLDDRTAHVPHQGDDDPHRIRFHVKPQALRLLMMERC